jgi:hypothetical protein
LFSLVNYFKYKTYTFVLFERIRKRIKRFSKTRGMGHVRLLFRLISDLYDRSYLGILILRCFAILWHIFNFIISIYWNYLRWLIFGKYCGLRSPMKEYGRWEPSWCFVYLPMIWGKSWVNDFIIWNLWFMMNHHDVFTCRWDEKNYDAI